MSKSPFPNLVTARDQARRLVRQAQIAGQRVGVVMTMGALHEGHLSLVQRSVSDCSFTAVTIFVNPTQFGPQEDFQEYPRDLQRDLELLSRYPVDLVFAPRTEEMYLPGHSTFVEPPRIAEPLEGQCRPGHFRGVTTIVLKLLQAVPADVAYFGQKDYQQFLVLKQMFLELDLATTICMCPTVREPDGLALSSRNAYLSPEQRLQSLAIARSLDLAQDLVDQGIRLAGELTARMREILHQAGIERIDYLAVADPESLQDVRKVDRRAIALIAAYVGKTRLIDNRLLIVR